MSDSDSLVEGSANIEAEIEAYLQRLPPEVLGLERIESVDVAGMSPGAYNLNYKVDVNDSRFIFRVNVDQQSGLPNQVEYEFNALKFLEGHGIAPYVYHLDDTRGFFDYGILIEEYLSGPHLTFEGDEVLHIADLLVRLHSLDPGGMPWVVWDDPLMDTYEQARRDLEAYKGKATPEEGVIRLAAAVLSETRSRIDDYRELYRADCVNHTDVVRDNFVKSPRGLRLIDWEKPRIDDASYDLGCFLSEPAQLWCTHLSERTLSREEKREFLVIYADLSGQDFGLLSEKVMIREPLISLHWVLWGAIKLCDLRDQYTAPELVQVHEDKRRRYERIADPRNIEKILEFT